MLAEKPTTAPSRVRRHPVGRERHRRRAGKVAVTGRAVSAYSWLQPEPELQRQLLAPAEVDRATELGADHRAQRVRSLPRHREVERLRARSSVKPFCAPV